MNKALYRLLSATLVIGMTVSMAACGGTAPATDGTTTTTSTTTAATDPAPAATTTTTKPQPQYGINPLTGLADMKTDNNRPVAIVVSDETASLVQLGIDEADMYFEAETEGGIPRMLCIFSSVDRVPDAVGPVRSARPHFVKMVKALDAIYGHVGGSPPGMKAIRDLGVKDMEDAAGIKHPTLINSSNYSWNRTAFTKDKVKSVIQSKKYATTTKTKSPFTFGEKLGDQPANTVDFKISASFRMAFTYDAAKGVYQKHRNSLNTPVHKAADGGAVEVSNVIVMLDNRYVDMTGAEGSTKTLYNFDLQSGSGYLATGGTVREIKWKRTNDQLSYYEADGTTPLTVAEGKTYIALTSKEYKSEAKFY